MTDDMAVIMPTIKAWEIIEQALIELGVTGPADIAPFKTRAEHGAKAIVARLAAHEPSILLCFPDELAERPGDDGECDECGSEGVEVFEYQDRKQCAYCHTCAFSAGVTTQYRSGRYQLDEDEMRLSRYMNVLEQRTKAGS